MKKIRLPNLIKADGFYIKRLFPNKHSELLDHLVKVYNDNIQHLIYWHRNIGLLLFKNKEDYIDYLRQNLMCYAIICEKNIIGCIEVSYLSKDRNRLKHRTLTYWIDKNYTRKHIISQTVNIFEKYFKLQNLDYICAEICANNTASKAFLEKNNFKEIYRYNSFSSFTGGYIHYEKYLIEKCINSEIKIEHFFRIAV